MTIAFAQRKTLKIYGQVTCQSSLSLYSLQCSSVCFSLKKSQTGMAFIDTH